MLPGIERQPRKKLDPSPERLLGLLHRWRDEALRAGRTRFLSMHAAVIILLPENSARPRFSDLRGVRKSGGNNPMHFRN
jgi:hypothetical protein